jgi:hypothetical protein
MTTSHRAFNQVKQILGKLDQRIDNLRAQRMSDRIIGQPAGTPTAQPISQNMIPAAPTADVRPTSAIPTPASLPQQAAQPSKSIYGRATPLRPNNP